MSLNAAELGVVVAHLADRLAGARLQGVISPADGGSICLALRTTGHTHHLMIRTVPGICGIGRTDKKPVSAGVPVPFVMLLRGRIDGARLSAITQWNRDRVVALRFDGAGQSTILLCELTDRLANLFALDGDGCILGSLHPNRSARRELVSGKPWLPPADPPFADDLPVRFPDGEDVDMAYERQNGDRSRTLAQQAKQKEVEASMAAVVKKKQTLQQRLQADLERALQADQLRHQAHVLQAHLREVTRGQRTFDTVDFNGEPICIPLLPERTPVANMQQMFDKAGRLARAQAFIRTRLTTVEEELARLEVLREQLRAPDADPDAILRGLRESFRAVEQRLSQKGKAPLRLPYRTYRVSGDHVARVGKSARDNDALTLQHANPSDLWLHVRGRPGSHVVVPLGRAEEPGPDLLLDAAHLAAHFSAARGADDVEITWTRRRFVQKRKGLPAGAVLLLHEKTFVLRVEKERLQRLLERAAMP